MANDLAEISAHYQGYLNRVKRELESATEDVAEDLVTAMRDLTGLTDHSLADLRDLDHPYARRHALGSAPHPDYEVHRQEGDLQDGLRPEHGGTWQNGQVVSEVHDDAEHLWHVLQGTEHMRPRDFASAAILQHLGQFEARYRQAFQNAGGRYRDDGGSVIQVALIEHDRQQAELPEGG